MKIIGFIITLLTVFSVSAQIDSLHYLTKQVVVKDSISFHTTSTNSYFFQITNKTGALIDKKTYTVDFGASKVYFHKEFYAKYPQIDSLQVQFYTYPEFLTKTYRGFDPSIIISNDGKRRKIRIHNEEKQLRGQPFEGMETKGNIIRGVTVGNNQDAVLNSVLDLRIEGKLSSKVSLRARISDTNIPIQENGYSQDLKDIDRVYIEMLGPKWKVKAGDVFLRNTDTYFMNFNKKVAGVAVETAIDSTHVFVSGALVRGRYTSQEFHGQEANQGPYKLNGPSGEAYIFIIRGSEQVFINGILLQEGKNADYLVDYNTAEITFTPTKPITSDMRIRVEFQYSDRNYSRFVTHNGGRYNGKKLQVGAYFYRESDMKNNPLQLNLSEEQIALLAQEGNSANQLLVTNAVETAYDENKILYRETSSGSLTIYEYSEDPNETLYQVSFTYMGSQQGDYQVSEYLAVGKKMVYVGENNGDYKALIPLVAPSKQQVFIINSQYKPSRKSEIGVELAYSDNDANLYSSIDDSSNKAPAVKASWQQVLLDTTQKGWLLKNKLNFDFLHRNFKSIERIFNVEFNRDWNTVHPVGNQSLLSTQLQMLHTEKGELSYIFENLNFTENFKAARHGIQANLQWNKFEINHQSSYLNSYGALENTSFLRTHSKIRYKEKKWWAGTLFDFENNGYKEKLSGNLTPHSFKYSDWRTHIGVGDSAKVFVELGAHFRTNDSLVNTALAQVNNSNTWFVNSQLIQTDKSQLKFYANYRTITYKTAGKTDALNSRLTYKQQLFNQFVTLQSDYQNTAGNIPQKEYTYIETEAGQGFYTWIDYNENGLQELDEFEIAQYADQATFLRIALPNIHYLPTQEARLRQSVQINFSKWKSETGYKKILSHWYNQLSILAQNNKKRTENVLNINPFNLDDPNVVGMQYNLRNSLVFNRGLAYYTTTYNYNNSRQKHLLSFGSQENSINLHQIIFQHKIYENWQLGVLAEQSVNSTDNESFNNRNYSINKQNLSPNITYFFNKNHWIKGSYSVIAKNNRLGELETLNKQELSLNYHYSNTEKSVVSLELKALKNAFTGNSLSAIGYQMLEGLQTGNNMTWNVLWTQKLNSFLYLNLNYNGRANSVSRTIHNGNVQLRANF